jgi:hypothetical protein
MLAPEAAHYPLAEQATLDARTLRALAALLMPLLHDEIEDGEASTPTRKGEEIVP